MKKTGIVLCLCIQSLLSWSQGDGSVELERDLIFGYPQMERYQKELRFESRQQRGGGSSLELPFFDDFAQYSLPTNDPEIPVEWQLWEDENVFINGTFPVSPPTVGVATFDGLAFDGYPYDFTDENSYGGADTLTSLPLNLAGFAAEDNVYLTFFYEPGGLGNNPDPQDSLVVEFYSPFGAGQWFRKWSMAGNNNVTFQQVFIQVNAQEFLMDGFRFRFRNYATLSGNVDHWHLDYVIVDEDIDPNNFSFDEVAMQYPNNTLLEEYTAMPLTHYLSNPAGFVRDQINFKQNNMGLTDENIVTSICITNEATGAEVCLPDDQRDFNVFGNTGEISRNLTLSSILPFDALPTDTCLIYDVNVFATTTDAHLPNDSASFKQVFYNYYAYDDGTAERAYALNVSGGRLAMKYFSEVEDTLLGLFIHWIPFQYDNSLETFLLRVWGDNGGTPGNELIENFNSYSPHYYHDGYNIFSYYEYDSPVAVEGTFYVGWTQSSNVLLNVGSDKNTNSNPAKLFYALGIGGSWTQSTITGSIMIRPVFKSGKSVVWNYVSENKTDQFSVFPNPTNDILNVSLNNEGNHTFELLDASGRELMSLILSGPNSSVDTSSISAGVYHIRITEQKTGTTSSKTIVVQ
ncbi:MAG: T9SS type A sorting domain-containing protein [Flavobacteriales bacterium]|nr:T9SS type A sorting domain-containing protein [Flavobacteriales bacterium]